MLLGLWRKRRRIVVHDAAPFPCDLYWGLSPFHFHRLPWNHVFEAVDFLDACSMHGPTRVWWGSAAWTRASSTGRIIVRNDVAPKNWALHKLLLLAHEHVLGANWWIVPDPLSTAIGSWLEGVHPPYSNLTHADVAVKSLSIGGGFITTHL